MKFTGSHLVRLPAPRLAALLADPMSYEGFDPDIMLTITPRRHDDQGLPTQEVLWNVVFRWRGGMRRITARSADPAETHSEVDPAPARYLIEGRQVTFDLSLCAVPVDAQTSRLEVSCAVGARSIGIRLLLEPLRLARSGAQARFDAGLALLATHLERIGAAP